VNVTLQAPPGATAFVQASCEVWGQVFATLPLRLTAATLTLQLLSGLPSSFIASDASSPWPLDPPLSLRVVTNDGAAVTDVSCVVSTSMPSTEFKVVGSTASLQSVAAHGTTGVVDVPPFVVQTSPTMDAVTVTVDCRRSSGDAPQPLTFNVPAIKLHAELCDMPQTASEVGTPLAPFGVGIVTVAAANGNMHNPCSAARPTMSLPPIVCTIALNASASTTNDTANIFLQHTLTTVAVASHRATFDTFTVVAPQGQTYGLSLTCAVGGLVIPPTLSFTVALAGCRPGQESVSVACVTCGGGTFSLGGMGAHCTGCPPAGAVCNAGILTLMPHYFRPAAQEGQPLGPDTELHPCYNSEACTLAYNASIAVYGCSPGYTGPLCGVCDAAANYARFGDTCDVCWDPSASVFFLAVVLIIVMAVLTHMALFSEVYNSYPDDAIVLRIAMSYLQGIGSLRVFIAGSTQAYASVMGWTEVVSASPLSVGALQCMLRMPYLTQYAGTVLLPVLASVIVIVIFLVGTTARSVRCGGSRQATPPTPLLAPPGKDVGPAPRAVATTAAASTRTSSRRGRCSPPTTALKSRPATLGAAKRHISTLLFVLFLTYMPITSASLRVLDCIPPVAGVRYLRSNLSVECGVGEHAAARVLAYFVLLLVGIGFPAGLAWLLGTARKEQLLDTAFHATWGFLFDGYRAPTRKLVPTTGTGSVTDVTKPGALSPAVVDSGGTGSTPTAAASAASPGASTNKLPAGSALTLSLRRQSSLMSQRLMQKWVVDGDSRVWWEAIVLARKAGVVLLAVLVTNPYMQCVGATLWFFGAILLQLKYTPYEKAKFNRLELATLTATFITAVVSTSLLQFNVDMATADLHAPAAMTPIEWAVTIVLVVINMGTFAALCFLWLRVQWDRARALWRALPLRRAALGAPSPPKTTSTPVSRTGTKRVDDRDRGTGTVKKGGSAMALTTANPMRSGGAASPAATPCMKAVPKDVTSGGASASAAAPKGGTGTGSAVDGAAVATVVRCPSVRVHLAGGVATGGDPLTSAARAALESSAS